MPAIVTKTQRISNANGFIEKFSGSPLEDRLYCFIAKTDPWNDDPDSAVDLTPDLPIGETFEQSKIYNDMIAMKRVDPSNFVLCAPTHKWTSGQPYYAWDDSYRESIVESGCSNVESIYEKAFYVVTGFFRVYKCLEAGSGNSFYEPSHTSIEPLEYPDGYVWHYMYTIETEDAITFYNNYFMPVREKIVQDENQSDIEGGIFKIVVTEGGSGYSSAPTVTIEGNGSGATATASIVGDAVSEIRIDVSGVDSTLSHGTGYDYARVVLSGGGGTGATARAVLSPKHGHGYNPPEELGAYNVEIAVDIDSDEGGDFIVTNDYRRIGLIENPMANGSPLMAATNVTMMCLKSMDISSVIGTFSNDSIITGASSTAKAYVDAYDLANSKIYFHQNEKTGWEEFLEGEGLSVDVNTALIDSINESEYEPFTGNILFIENRDPIIRTSSTKEEIRIVVQF
jgi:hypothetical protein